MKLILNAAVCSDVGRVRQKNEDNFYLMGSVREDVSQPRRKDRCRCEIRESLFAVADGMGGEANGEAASLMTVQSLHPCQFDAIHKTAAESIRQANRLICQEIERNRGRRMGSTLAALYIDAGKAVCCNVGDSRGYLLRHGHLRQLTEDHTRVQQMVRMGMLTPEQAAGHKNRHILSQNIGIFEDEMVIEPAFSEPVALEQGDIFLLCSDGLTDMVTDPQIGKALNTGTAAQMVRRLVKLALEHGGKDNVTALVVQVRGPSLPFFCNSGKRSTI